MKTTYQATQTPFHALSIQDAITMVPLMDELASKFQQLSKEKLESDHNRTEYIQLGKQLFILEKLGFCPSCEGMIQYDPELFPEIREEIDRRINS